MGHNRRPSEDGKAYYGFVFGKLLGREANALLKFIHASLCSNEEVREAK